VKAGEEDGYMYFILGWCDIRVFGVISTSIQKFCEHLTFGPGRIRILELNFTDFSMNLGKFNRN
jgi:hypothetical protein